MQIVHHSNNLFCENKMCFYWSVIEDVYVPKAETSLA